MHWLAAAGTGMVQELLVLAQKVAKRHIALVQEAWDAVG